MPTASGKTSSPTSELNRKDTGRKEKKDDGSPR